MNQLVWGRHQGNILKSGRTAQSRRIHLQPERHQISCDATAVPARKQSGGGTSADFTCTLASDSSPSLMGRKAFSPSSSACGKAEIRALDAASPIKSCQAVHRGITGSADKAGYDLFRWAAVCRGKKSNYFRGPPKLDTTQQGESAYLRSFFLSLPETLCLDAIVMGFLNILKYGCEMEL